MSEVRLRFPPSPTGYLHIGSARTALYNWLYARKHGGKLVLRIEDTDLERSTQASIDGIIDGLKWLGIDWDEGPYFQTQFADEHKAAATKLLDSGHAYKCFCTKEELDAKREAAVKAKSEYGYDGTCRDLTPDEVAAKEAQGLPSVVRFKIPQGEGSVVFEDQVFGRIEKAYRDLDDFVIVRSDGSPLYMLSNVVDDVRDRITHIVRGADGLGNTPRQILLYQALGAPIPTFAHMPLTLDHQKAKISKRKHGEIVAIHFYKERGFIPWAFNNFLVLLGWSPGNDQEIFTREELIEAFSLDRINRSNSVFNYKKNDPKFFTDPKAISINSHWLRTLPIQEVVEMAKPFMVEAGIWDEAYDGDKRDWLLTTADLIRSRFHTLDDFCTAGRAYFAEDFEIEERAIKKNITKHPGLKEWLPQLSKRLEGLADFKPEALEEEMRAFAQELDVKVGVIVNGVRTVVTGRLAGPSMFEALELIGRERTVARLADVDHLYG